MNNVFADFLMNKGLYDPIEITKDNINDLCDLIGGRVRISIYCKECEEVRVFSMVPITYYREDGKKAGIHDLADKLSRWQGIQNNNIPAPESRQGEREWSWAYSQVKEETRIMVFPFSCTMDSNHRIDFIVHTKGTTLRKIGQYPSLADLTLPELNNYKKVADNADLKELRRAIGLNAHGVGAGAYVYLRRIFERMVYEEAKKAISEGKIDKATFNNARMKEKIELIKEYLPDILVNTPELYGIISKGIHELSEEECEAYFPVMREAIMMIYSEREEKRKKAENEKQLKASLSKIASQIN